MDAWGDGLDWWTGGILKSLSLGRNWKSLSLGIIKVTGAGKKKGRWGKE
jgi:hypothetical protein